MQPALSSFRLRVAWAHWKPAVRSGLIVAALFGLALAVTQRHDAGLRAAVEHHAALGALVFMLTSVIAVLLPALTNLPLVPLAVLAFGPAWTAALLLAGWVTGAALAFAVGRHARPWLISRLPSVMRHAQIDRLIDPRHRLLSLTLLRMTFPVDVLSYALGLFSPRTRAIDNALSTLIGAAPFALLFAWFPHLAPLAQAAVLVACTALFLGYAAWILRQSPEPLA